MREKEAIRFLKHIFAESVPDIANILVAEAEGDKDTILRYLGGVVLYLNELIHDIKEDGQ